MNVASGAVHGTEHVSSRIKKLEDIEKSITQAVTSAGMTLQELGKDKPADRAIDRHVSAFASSLDEAETELVKQINYLSQVATNQQHEGSSYAARYRSEMMQNALVRLTKQVDNMIAVCEAPDASKAH